MIGLRAPTLVTIGLLVLMYAVFAVQCPNMATPRGGGNLLTDGIEAAR